MIGAISLKMIAIPIIITMLAIAGIWYNVYDDESIKVDARLKSYNIGDSEAVLELKIENKLSEDIRVFTVRYNAYADAEKTILVAQGAISDIYLPAGTVTYKVFKVKIQNIDEIEDKLYFEGNLVVEIGDNYVENLVVEREIAVPNL